MFRRRKKIEPPAPAPLTPGFCECGHIRSVHQRGTGACGVSWPPDAEWPTGKQCACVIYIFDPDENEGDDLEEEPTPDPSELERLYNG